MANPKIEVEIGGSLSKLQKALKDAQAQLQTFGNSVSTKMSAFSKSITDAEGKFQKFGASATNAGQALSLGLTAPILAFGAAALKSFGDVQALKLGLEAVTGSTEEAEKQFARLTEIAKLPGLGLNEAVQGAINLQVIGFTAEKAEKSLQLFGNAVATVGKGKVEFERAIYGLQQLANTDFPLGEDLNILKDAIPQITPLLKEAFGTSRSDDLQKLKISSAQLIDTILIGLEKLPPVAGGINNAFENLGDSIKGSLSGIGESINKTLNVEGFLNKISDTIISLSKSFTELDSATQTIIIVFAGLAAGIGPLILAIGGIISALPLIISGFVALTGPIGLISIAIAAAIPLIIALNGELERTGQIKAEERLKSLNATVEFVKGSYEDLTKVFQKNLGISETEARKKALESLLQTELNLLNVRGKQNKDVEAIKLRVAAINQLQAELGLAIVPAEGLSKSLGLIGGLTAQINTLNEQRDLAKDQNEVNLITAKVSALQDQLALINAIAKRAAEPVKSEVGVLAPRDNPFAGGLPFADSKASKAAVTQGVQTAPTAQMKAATEAGKKAIDAYYAEIRAYAAQFSGELQQILEGGITNTFANLGSSIGEAIATGANVFEAAGKSLLRSLGSFLGELGYMMIQYGTMAIVKAKLDASLLVPGAGFVTGPLAIAAGVALVALSSAIGAKASGGGGGGGGSVGSGVSGQSFTGTGLNAMQIMNIGGEFTVKGSDLVFVLSQEEKKRKNG